MHSNTKLLLIILILAIAPMPVQASVSYNIAENTIYLDNGTNTLATILTDVNNASAISYTDGEYTLYAAISQIYTPWDTNVVLKINDSTLIIDDTTIFTYNDLYIDNATIKPLSYSNPWFIHNFDNKDFDVDYFSMVINDSDISGGVIKQGGTGEAPIRPTLIYNNYWHDYTGDAGYMLYLGQGAAEQAILYNNTFENIHLTSGQYNGILKMHNPSAYVEKLYIYNSSTVSYGMIYNNGGGAGLTTFDDFHFKNITGHGIASKEFSSPSLYKNGLIEDVHRYESTAWGFAIEEKHSMIYGSKVCTIENVTINNAYGGIRGGAGAHIDFNIYNVTIDDTSYLDITSSAISSMYMINFRTLNYNGHYTPADGEIRNYALADIYVVDGDGNPVENVIINVETNITGVTDTSVNMYRTPLTSVTTLSNGHTPLPSENTSGTLSLMLEYADGGTVIPTPSYTITVEKDGYTNSTIIYPDLSWYRSNPNAYQNTTTIVLPMAIGNQSSFNDTPVSIAPSTTQTTPGDIFTLSIPITPETPIAGAQFNLLYDGSMATVTSVTEGNFLNQDGATTQFVSGIIDDTAGTVTNVYGTILGETSVSSQGSMAIISMTAGGNTGYLNLNLSNVMVSDSNGAAAPYTLTNATVLIDTAPVLGSIGAKSVDVGSALTFTTSASDVDGDSLTYSATGLPAGASINTATGAFSWTPANGEAGIYVVIFEVTDGYISDSEAVTITVNGGNNAPVITTFVPSNSLTFDETYLVTIDIIATDADGDALTYDIKIDGVTKSTSSSYVWETDYSSAGTHTIDITVSDGIEQVTDSRTITINDVQPRWDVNEDGTVDVLDISIIGQKYDTSVEAPYPRWDVNQDGIINVQDMTLTAYYFGEAVV